MWPDHHRWTENGLFIHIRVLRGLVLCALAVVGLYVNYNSWANLHSGQINTIVVVRHIITRNCFSCGCAATSYQHIIISGQQLTDVPKDTNTSPAVIQIQCIWSLSLISMYATPNLMDVYCHIRSTRTCTITTEASRRRRGRGAGNSSWEKRRRCKC